MKANLLLISAILMAASSLHAANLSEAEVLPKLDLQSAQSSVRPANSPAAESQIYWSYSNEDERIASIGLGFPEKLFFAQELPANNPLLAGKTLKAIRFKCQGTEFYDEAEVWVAPCRPETDEEITELISLDVTTLQDSIWNEVPVTPVVIPDEGLCVGWNIYAHDLSDRRAEYPALVSFPQGIKDVPNGETFWMRATQYMTNWMGSPRFGHLCIQVLVEGEFEEYVVTLGDVPTQIGIVEQQVNVPLLVSKMGSKDVTDFDFTVTTNGISSEEYHVALANPIVEIDAPRPITIAIPTGTESTFSTRQITVTKVNGHDNEAKAQEAQTFVDVIAVSESAHRRNVMEEYTGTWCGWCPRGFIAMERLTEDFGEDFIGIAVHASDPWGDGTYLDPMGILPYEDLIHTVSSYPNSSTNRSFMCDPYAGTSKSNYGIKTDMESELAKITVADIDLIAEWETADSLTINSVTSVTFKYSRNDAPYALVYVLLSDSIYHPNDPDYVQANFYAEFTDDEEYTSNPDYAEYLNKPRFIADQVYNHVAVDAYGVNEGLDESIVAPLVAGETQTFDFSIDVDFNSLIQDKKQLSLVAMLLDLNSGQIVNAIRKTILPAGSIEAIDHVNAEHALNTVRYYSLDGKLMQQPKGLVIMSNGLQTKKVMR